MQTAESIKIDTVEVYTKEEFEGRIWLRVWVPNGWEDMQNLAKMIRFEDKVFEQTGWNSDLNYAYYREIKSDEQSTRFATPVKDKE